MGKPLLNKALERERISALLASFMHMLAGAHWAGLVDVEGRVVGCHPAEAQGMEPEQLRLALDKARQFERLVPLPTGVVMPVRARGELVGALVVSTSQTPTSHEKAALRFLVSVLSLVIETSLAQKELLQETLERYRETSLLYRVVENIAASLDLAQVNGLILDECMRLVEADEGTVMLEDRETGQLTVWASRGLDAVEDIGAGVPSGHELARRVLQDGKSQVFEGAALQPTKRSLTALMCVPLKTQDHVLGVISLAYTRPGQTFRANETRLLSALATQAAVAIDNARMFSDLSGLHTELAAANQRLLELNQLKSSFLGVITHELRSPLANIDFSLQVIERYGLDGWRQEQQEQWTQLIDLVHTARGMIDSLVSFASLLSKQGDLFLNQVDFSALVDTVAESLAPVARSRQVTLHVDGSPAVSPILADEMRLAEAVYHLIHNAIKFNQAGGTVQVQYWQDDGRIAFEVQDTGVGIAAEKLALLGDPFAQIADPFKRGMEGLGLGLALVNYVVHAHGGQLTMSSQVGIGSQFGFWLPVAGPPLRGQQLSREQPAAGEPAPFKAPPGAINGRSRLSPPASAPTPPPRAPTAARPAPVASSPAEQNPAP